MATQTKAYVIAEVDVHDAEGFEAYRSGVAPMIAAFGGRYLVRGGGVTALEGDAPSSRMVVIEFPSKAAAETFWHSEEYRPVAALRHKTAHSRIYMIEGVVP
jgi:uncharacterized protein (DUF1330 family)